MEINQKEFKSGFVSLIGRTNVGKSTLLNLLVGEKVAAIANKVQTTRTAIKGIVNRENSQIIFVDTPGIHKPKTKLNETMVETSFISLTDSDVVLFLIEATSTEIGKGDRIILDKIKETNRKTILIINKIDLVKRETLLNLIDIYSKEYDFSAVIPISATNIKYKEIILDEIEKNLKNGPAYYDIEGNIYCLKNSHKGIIIGKNGEMLKKIGRLARIDMEENFGVKINLKTWVKVKEDWQDNKSIVDKFKLK